MTFNLDFALFYAYTLCLFSFLLFWLIPQLIRAFAESIGSWNRARKGLDAGVNSRPSRPPQTKLEAFRGI
jgi:hypothetical protein